MANERQQRPDVASGVDPDPSDTLSGVGVRLVERTHTAIDQARAVMEGSARLVAELARVNGAFELIADRLVAATLKASHAATSGAAPSAVLVPFVEELADLARRSLQASGDGQRHLRDHDKASAPMTTAVRDAHAALDALSAVLEHLAEPPVAKPIIPAIQVETRPPPIPEEAMPVWRARLGAPVGRYKN
jgi:hypothetical protein